MKIAGTRRHYFYALVILFLILSALYLGVYSHYMPEYIDDAWFFSWAWNLYEHGEYRDIVFGEQNGGTIFFQRTPAIVYGAVASILGWSRGVAMGVSKLFVLATAFIWYRIVRKLGYHQRMALAFAGIMLLLEAYFGIANKLRPEPLALFLCSAAFLLFLHERYLFSGFILGIAIESHPFAVIGGFWVLAYLLVLWPRIKARPKAYILRALRYTAGLLFGFGYWYWLHGETMSQLGQAAEKAVGNVFLEYFFLRRFSWRHWPELAVILTALIVFIIRRKYKTHPFVLPFLTAVTVIPFILTRGNLHYIVYIYPAAILLIVIVVEDLKALHLLVYAILLFQLPQYAWLFQQNRNYNHREFMTRLKQAVPPDEAFIYGNPNAWFAFQERNFHAYGYFGRAGLLSDEWPDEFVVIETSDFIRWYGQSDMDNASSSYTREDLAEWIYWDGKPVKVYRLVRRE